jgi:hypothetical protein
VCEALLEELVREHFLNKTTDGAYIALPSPRVQLKAELVTTVIERTA